MAWRTFNQAHWPALVNLFTSVAGALRGLVTHFMTFLAKLQTRRTAVHLAIAPGQRLSASGDAGVHEQVHGVLAIMRPDSRSAVNVAGWGEPAARTSGCPRGPESRPHTEQPPLYRTVRAVDEEEGLNRRRVTSPVQCSAGTRGIGDAVPWRARSPTAPERVDRISAHTAFSASSAYRLWRFSRSLARTIIWPHSVGASEFLDNVHTDGIYESERMRSPP